jgi:hypothetical protein
VTAPKLFEVRLPAGDVSGFDIDLRGDNRARQYHSADWLSKGYDGVRFVGAGAGVTHVRRHSDAVWTNVGVLQHNGVVQLEALTLHNAPRSAIQAGTGLWTPGLPFYPKFKLVTRGVELRCDVPGKWGFFTYECDRDDEDLEIWGALLREHPSYAHEFSYSGLLWNRVTVRDSGGECCKLRPDPTEIRPLKRAHSFVVRNSSFAGWVPGDRGSAGIVIQGGGPSLQVLIEKTIFWGGPGPRCRCVMIDDGWYKTGVATGNVVLRQVAAQGSSIRDDYGETLVRVGPLHAGVMIASSVTIDQCSLWGQNMAVQLTGIPVGKLAVRNSNTPSLRDWASARGMDTLLEAQIPRRDRRVPISEGLVA